VERIDKSGRTVATAGLLAITVIEGDDLPVDEKQAQVFGNAYRIVTYGCAISRKGTISYFYRRFDDVKGSGYPILPKNDLEELRRLAGNLPNDGSRLPPLGRRLVIQAVTRSAAVVRVYDRANLPDPVLEILRVSHAAIKPWSVHFPAKKVGSPQEFSEAGIAAHWPRPTSPDGTLEIAQGYYEIVVSSPDRPALHEFREPEINRHIDGLYGAFFTPDGRFLLVQSTHPALRIYDTNTWQPVESLPGIPADAVGYFPDKDWKVGVFASAGGEIGKDTGMVAWWGDSEHLLTIVRPDGFFTDHNLALWNAKTGRYRGDLSGCDTFINRFMVSAQDGRVFAECYSGGTYMWDGSADMRRISEFEQSLAHGE
jgi:hypothetical protein